MEGIESKRIFDTLEKKWFIFFQFNQLGMNSFSLDSKYLLNLGDPTIVLTSVAKVFFRKSCATQNRADHPSNVFNLQYHKTCAEFEDFPGKKHHLDCSVQFKALENFPPTASEFVFSRHVEIPSKENRTRTRFSRQKWSVTVPPSGAKTTSTAIVWLPVPNEIQ